MAEFTIEEKDSFTVLGLGTDLKSHYTDFEGIDKEKMDFWQKANKDGRLDSLKAVASNNYVFIVNEAVNNKMMYYAGVMVEQPEPELTAREDARVIQFPEGEYLVVRGEAESSYALSRLLTNATFGEALQEAKGVAYVGGPNAAVEMGQRDGLHYGEMWVPIVRK